MLRSTKYPRLGNKLGLSYKSVNPVVISAAPATPTWYGTNTKGFSIGGAGGGNVADKATFSTETTAAQTSANLTAGRAQISSGGNDTQAYYIGGTDASDVSQTSANKLTHSNDTMASNTSAALPAARSGILAAVYTTANYSYGGSAGANSNDQSAAYKTTYSNDTTAAQTSANLATGRASGMTLSSDTAAMYFGGFRNVPSGFTQQTIADKMPFSTETSANNTSLALPTARAYGNYGSINSTLNTKGYLSASNTTNTFTKVTYSTDTASNLAATGIQQGSGMSSTTIGYTLGGYTTTQVVTAYKFTVSSETSATISAMNKSVAKSQSAGCC
jgi:hypothetical protein